MEMGAMVHYFDLNLLSDLHNRLKRVEGKVVSVEQLQEENMELKAKVEVLEYEFWNLYWSCNKGTGDDDDDATLENSIKAEAGDAVRDMKGYCHNCHEELDSMAGLCEPDFLPECSSPHLHYSYCNYCLEMVIASKDDVEEIIEHANTCHISSQTVQFCRKKLEERRRKDGRQEQQIFTEKDKIVKQIQKTELGKKKERKVDDKGAQVEKAGPELKRKEGRRVEGRFLKEENSVVQVQKTERDFRKKDRRSSSSGNTGLTHKSRMLRSTLYPFRNL